jgi:hypothetical protein
MATQFRAHITLVYSKLYDNRSVKCVHFSVSFVLCTYRLLDLYTTKQFYQVLNIDGKSTNNPHTIANAFNEYYLSLAEKKCVVDDDDDDDDDDDGNDDSSNRNNKDNTYTTICSLLNALSTCFQI